jgi:Tfp pilus assembly protein PilF
MHPRLGGRAGPSLAAALVAFTAMAATCGNRITEKQIKESDLHLEMANSHLEEGRLVDARREAFLSIQANPKNAEAHFTLAYVFGQLDQWGKAEDEARLAIKHAKSYPEASNLLGVILIEQGRYKEAVGVLTDVAEDFLYTTPHLAYGNLGLAYLRMEKFDKAMEALEKAVELQPMFCLGYFRMGLVYFEQNRYKDALEKLEKAVGIEDPWKQCSRLQDAHKVIGLIHSELESPEEALEAFRRCLEVDPNSTSGLECKKRIEEIEDAMEPAEAGATSP